MGTIMYKNLPYAGGSGGSGGASSIDELSDVELTELADGDILKYDSTEEKWVNSEDSGGTMVIANPEGTPTDDLDTIQIGDVIYDIPGSGGGSGGGVVVDTLYTGHIVTTSTTPYELPHPITDYDFLVVAGWIYNSGSNCDQFHSVVIYKDDYFREAVGGSDATYWTHMLGGGSSSGRRVGIYFPDESHFIVNKRDTASLDVIYGIKFGSGGGGGGSSTPVLLYDTHTTATGTYELEDSIDKYNYLLVCGYNYNKSLSHNQYISLLIYKDDYYIEATTDSGTSSDMVHLLGNMTSGTSGDNPRRVMFSFSDSTHITISGISNSSLDKIYGLNLGSGGGTDVEANPDDPSTDELTSIRIGDTVYDIKGSGGNVPGEKTLLFQQNYATFPATITLSEPYTNFDYLEFNYYKTDDSSYYDYISSELFSKEMINAALNGDISGRTNTLVLLGFEGGSSPQYARYRVTNTTTLTKVNARDTWGLRNVYGIKVGGGTDVEANPVGEPTEELNTIRIGQDIYEIVGGGSGDNVKNDLLYDNDTSSNPATITLDSPYTNYDIIFFRVIRSADSTEYYMDIPYNTKNLSVGDKFEFIGWANSNNYLSYSITDSVTLTRFNQGSNFTIHQIYGVKLGTGSPTYSPVIYSESERKIGVWEDNKPLYQKTVTILNDVAWTNNSTYNLNINDPDTIWVYDGYIYDGRSTAMTNHTNPIIQSSDRGGFNINLSNKSQLKFIASATWSASSDRYAVITVRYTKTTDQPGSGDYNTLGVPTVHYTADEQVIGTWVDGKPLYQKTVTFQNISNETALDHGLEDVDMVLQCDGILYRSSDNLFLPFTYSSTSSSSSRTANITRTKITFYGTFTNITAYITFQYTKTTDQAPT